MLASIVLASFLCTIDSNNADKCEVAYEEVWTASGSTYARDRDDCAGLLERRYPNDITNDPQDPNKFTFAGCYRVLPGEWVGLTPKAVYLQNVYDADDSFTDRMSKLELN